MGIKTVLGQVGIVLSLIFILSFLFSSCYLCLTSSNLFMVTIGVLILLLLIGAAYLGLREEISSLFTRWREKKRERERRKKKVVQEISPPQKRKKETKIKKIEPKTPISSEPEIRKASSKGEIMRELGLPYEKPKKTENKIEPPSIFPQFREKEDLSKRKKLAYLQSTGIIQSLIEKGELEISRQWHIGQMRGADIAEKLIKPILREFNIRVSIEHNHKSIIFLEEREREKLRKEIEKLER